MRKIKWVLISIWIVIVVSIGGCSSNTTDKIIEKEHVEVMAEVSTPLPPPTPIPTPVPEPEIYKANIRAVGDIMVHKWQLWEAYDQSTDTYDFSRQFEAMKSYLQDADITVGNLETSMGGKEAGGYSDYPQFNTPEVLVDTLKDVGFDLLQTTNNHSLDRREKGLVGVLDQLDRVGIVGVGTARTPNEAEKVNILEANNIQFAFLAYTYGTNGIPVPKDKPYMINLMDEQKMIADIENAKNQNPDIIVVMLHFGNEYEIIQNKMQEDIVNTLFEAGADIILGSHPHVLQPMEVRSFTQPDGTVTNKYVIYSLGNFISCQTTHPRDAGVVVDLQFEKIEGEKGKLVEVSFMPTWSQFARFGNTRCHRVLPVEETLERYQSGEEKKLHPENVKRMEQVIQEEIKQLGFEDEQALKKDNYFYKVPFFK